MTKIASTSRAAEESGGGKGPGQGGQTTVADDLARRVVHRRTELGLSVDELAAAAGVDPVYLRYFEGSPSATLSAGTLQLIALALKTTPIALLGGEVDRPPGHGRAGRHPVLEALTREHCEAHLAVGGVGRIVYMAGRGPVALPVNFEFTEGEIVFCTNASKAAVIGADAAVGFEVDRVDDAVSEGWSVLVSGRGRTITDPQEMARLSSLDLVTWAGGERSSLVVIRPDEITGRVIVHQSDPDED
jgi:nitroimidazol reductase NimA-like FMN-containing flavoprotein (pyridoxamine 5'-phosphate oxidase superfamily)